MQTEKHEGEEILEQQVRLWMDKNGIPYQRYWNLSNHYKVVLHNLVCIPTRPTTHHQRRELYEKLCLPDLAGKHAIDPVDFMPDEKRQEFFMPVPPSEDLDYQEKF